MNAELSADENGKRLKGFIALFFIEMWERFGYYGMAILVVLFLKDYMGFDDSRANLTWGAFAAMVYAVPTIGGWIGDRVLGARRTTVLGAMVLAVGYIMLAIPGPAWFLFFSLGVVAIGNGLFKANPNNLVSKLYEGQPAKVDSAFTMYYMAVNVGAMISQFATPIVRVNYGWHAGFAVCAVGLVLGLLNFSMLYKNLKHIGSAPDFEPIRWGRVALVLLGSLGAAILIALILQNTTVAKAIVWLATAILLGIFAYLIKKSGKGGRSGLITVLMLTAQGILFFIFYQQMSTSLTLFALRNVDLNVGGYMIPPEQFQLLNPIWIVALSPLLAWFYNHLGRGKGDLNIATKFAIGFAMLAVGFFIYGFSSHFAGHGKVSWLWMVGGYLFQSLGELLISGLGLAMVARFIPGHLRGFMMGAWFLATGIAQYLGSVVANIASIPEGVTDPVKTLPLYADLFNGLGIVAVVGTFIAVIMLPWMKRLQKAHAEFEAM